MYKPPNSVCACVYIGTVVYHSEFTHTLPQNRCNRNPMRYPIYLRDIHRYPTGKSELCWPRGHIHDALTHIPYTRARTHTTRFCTCRENGNAEVLGGEFTVSFLGQTTGYLPHDVDQGTLATALTALSTVGTVEVVRSSASTACLVRCVPMHMHMQIVNAYQFCQINSLQRQAQLIGTNPFSNRLHLDTPVVRIAFPSHL